MNFPETGWSLLLLVSWVCTATEWSGHMPCDLKCACLDPAHPPSHPSSPLSCGTPRPTSRVPPTPHVAAPASPLRLYPQEVFRAGLSPHLVALPPLTHV